MIRTFNLSLVSTLYGSYSLIIDDSTFSEAKRMTLAQLADFVAASAASGGGLLLLTPTSEGYELSPYTTDESGKLRFYQHSSSPTGEDVLKLGGKFAATAFESFAMSSFAGGLGVGPVYLVNFTDYQGVAVALKNQTGTTTLAGTIVSITTDGFQLATAAPIAGVVCQSGVANGSDALVLVRGIGKVLLKDGVDAAANRIVKVSTTAGRGETQSLGSPDALLIWQKVGISLESVSTGVDVSVKTLINI